MLRVRGGSEVDTCKFMMLNPDIILSLILGSETLLICIPITSFIILDFLFVNELKKASYSHVGLFFALNALSI